MTGSRAKPKKRSPLKEARANMPGESLEAYLETLFEEKVMFWFLAAAIAAIFAVIEWLRWFFAPPPQPIFLTVVAALVIAVAVRRLVPLIRRIRAIRQGIEGEKSVGQLLEVLRERQYLVFHDIKEDDFNIDHALIGPAGVFAIETRTISKPEGRDAKVFYDGERVLIDGIAPSRDPVAQAMRSADHLKKILEQATGLKIPPVRPVVLFPGWYVKEQRKGTRVWVLNPKVLPSFIEQEPQILSDEEIKQLGFFLSQYLKLRRDRATV